MSDREFYVRLYALIYNFYFLKREVMFEVRYGLREALSNSDRQRMLGQIVEDVELFEALVEVLEASKRVVSEIFWRQNFRRYTQDTLDLIEQGRQRLGLEGWDFNENLLSLCKRLCPNRTFEGVPTIPHPNDL